MSDDSCLNGRHHSPLPLPLPPVPGRFSAISVGILGIFTATRADIFPSLTPVWYSPIPVSWPRRLFLVIASFLEHFPGFGGVRSPVQGVASRGSQSRHIRLLLQSCATETRKNILELVIFSLRHMQPVDFDYICFSFNAASVRYNCSPSPFDLKSECETASVYSVLMLLIKNLKLRTLNLDPAYRRLNNWSHSSLGNCDYSMCYRPIW